MIYHGYLWQFFQQKKKILKINHFPKNIFFKNYYILLCLVATLKWVGKLSFDFLYLGKNNSCSRQAKQIKSKDSFTLTTFFFFFFLILSNLGKRRKLYSVLVHLDSRICTCGFRFKWLKSKYHVWIVLKDQEFQMTNPQRILTL